MGNLLKTVRNMIIRVLVLFMVFVVAIYVFARILNQSTPNTSETMADATFPLVYMQNDDVSYNCLHGYAYEMDVNYIRDTVTILDSSHELDIRIQPFNTNIESVSYEVLTLDGSESLENTSVINLTEDDEGYLEATLTIQNQVLLNQEYILKIQLSAGARNIYFYTRLLLEDGLHLDSYLDFVTGFYAKCVNKTDQTSLGVVVEPDDTTGTSQTLASMDIHDTVAQLMWGSLNPSIYYKPTPSLVDINGTTASFVLNYCISAVDEEGITCLYRVKEFYRLRYTDTRVYLLDFTRTTDEIFNTERTVLESGGINLGITDGDVEYMFDEDKSIVAFVQENELWTYEINGGKLSRVFGFLQEEDMDYRDFYDQNNIKILRVGTNGDVWYVVSGYMNRGDHEGENGIAVYYYENSSATSRELLFVRTMEAYDSLKLDVDALAYLTDDETDCYILLENVVYRIDMATGEYESVITGVNNGCYTSSGSNRYFSWLAEGERYNSQTLCTIDFETGEVREITCGTAERIRQVCYMEENLVYGVAMLSDIDSSAEGSEVFPMYMLTIVGEDGEVIKEYSPSNAYVVGVEQSNSMLTLTRVTKVDGEYAETTSDTIVSTNTEDSVEYGVSTETDDVKQTVILLRVGTTITDTNPQVVTGKFTSESGSATVEIPANEDKEKLYYVYAGGSLDSSWPTAAEAILRADEMVGVVINDAKEYVWERGNTEDEASISLDDIPEIVRTGTMDVDELEAAMNRDVVDLTGCTLEQVLYFVSEGKAVIAATETGSVIITGYDDYGNLILLNPGETETYYYGPNDSLALFEAAGNRFVSYLNTELS
ncbi:MAG: hypothetical protein LUF35_13760 [Lachnospiraceae bacterium]|nr:hypothetical protein [Lachnospiraceae bacterium]